jgi:hypothetical protein
MRSTLLLFTLFCAGFLSAQNLIPNGNFEDTLPRTTPLYLPTDWVVPNISSPDYLTALNGSSNFTDGAPQNFNGYQFAHSGQGYMGLVIYSFSGSGNSKRFREYIQNEMSNSLQKDSLYCLQLFVSLADSSIYAAKNKLAIYFSSDKIQSNDRYSLPYTPQVLVYPELYLVEKKKWMQYNFQYKAQGGEKFITIGNFTDSTEIDTLNVEGGSRLKLEHIGSYYYIDDVYLGSCDSIPFDTGVGLQESELIGRNHRLYPNPASEAVRLTFEVRVNEEFTFSLYDLQGRLVQEQLLQVGNEHRIVLQKDYFVPRNRLYLYQIRYANGEFLSGKLVVE